MRKGLSFNNNKKQKGVCIMPNNAINNVNETTIAQFGSIMADMAAELFKDHADSIIERLQEEALDNEAATQITVPMKMLIVYDDGEFEFKPSIDLKKTTRVTFELPPAKWNPNQPDLFDGKQSKEPEAGNIPGPPEAEPEAEKKPAKKPEKKDDKKFVRCGHKHPKFPLQCRLEKGHTGACDLKPCGFKEPNGTRVCMAEKGHDGEHVFFGNPEAK
jgi:hypothetical protein